MHLRMRYQISEKIYLRISLVSDITISHLEVLYHFVLHFVSFLVLMVKLQQVNSTIICLCLTFYVTLYSIFVLSYFNDLFTRDRTQYLLYQGVSRLYKKRLFIQLLLYCLKRHCPLNTPFNLTSIIIFFINIKVKTL